MTRDLRRKKVVVINGKHSIGRAIAEAVAREGADMVIWLREWNDDLNQAQVLPLTQPELPSKQVNGTSPHMSLWRQTLARKSYW
jgi:NAD(P)-dependent dehydrogenase (short-subunit alcohol dehydrogenase family)